MSNIIVKEKDIVIPGEVLAEGMDYLPGDNTYREGERIFSKILGLIGIAGRVIKITPLSGPYVPKVGDKIIGKVFDITMNGFRMETETAYSAMLNVRDATTRFVRSNEGLDQILSYQYTAAPDFEKFQAHTIHYTAPLPWRDIFVLYGGYSKIKTHHNFLPANVHPDFRAL